MKVKVQTENDINNTVRKLSRAGYSDEEIIATLTEAIKAAIQERSWGKPWMGAMQATLARIKREGSKALLHN
jgi:hypothetical protein